MKNFFHKLFKKNTKVSPWVNVTVRLADGSLVKPGSDIAFANLASHRLWDCEDEKIEWTFDGQEWFSSTPTTWDVYWLA